MGHVFVSYSRRDVERVDLIVEALLEAGIGVWIDRSGIEAGQTWREQIVEAIDTCEAFILMLSPNSVLSDNVRREIDLAADSKRTIFPLRLEPVELSRGIRYQLTGLQFIDVHQLGFEESMQRLLTTLKKKLTNSPKQKIIVRQSELVIHGNFSAFGENEQARLMEFLADLCQTDPSRLSIAGTAPGSVHVFVDMPAETAFRLKTMALNREKRLKRFGIASLRLTGDSKFINVALGVLTTTATIGALHLLWLSLPSLLPSVFGVAAGKVIVVTAAVAATTYLGAQVANSISNSPPPAPTETITLTITPSPLPTGTAPLIPVSGATEVATEEPSATPTEAPTQTRTFTPWPTFTFTFTPSRTNTPTNTPTDTPTFTPSPTDTPTDTPSPTITPTQPPPIFTYIKGIGDYSCPVGYTLATYSDATTDGGQICSILDTWDIARLAGGGSFDGGGYGCQFRSVDNRSLGHSVCKPGSPIPIVTLTPFPTDTLTPPLFVRGLGDYSCPVGYTPVTYSDAAIYQDLICSVLDIWDIARLEGGGSFDGFGYGCGFRSSDDRSLGHTVCKANP